MSLSLDAFINKYLHQTVKKRFIIDFNNFSPLYERQSNVHTLILKKFNNGNTQPLPDLETVKSYQFFFVTRDAIDHMGARNVNNEIIELFEKIIDALSMGQLTIVDVIHNLFNLRITDTLKIKDFTTTCNDSKTRALVCTGDTEPTHTCRQLDNYFCGLLYSVDTPNHILVYNNDASKKNGYAI